MPLITLVSGGLDSAVLLAHLHAEGHPLRALSVDYGQRHVRELEAAAAICAWAEVPHLVVDLTTLAPVLAGSSQTSPTIAVPHGHYADASMKLTVVPNRNMLLLATALAWAVSTQAEAVAYACHAGDHPIYPDCRPAFVDAMRAAAHLAAWEPLDILTPFVTWTKADIVRRGAELGVPFADTYSCYEGGAQHCGQCGTCTERREAFLVAGVRDPTEYADVGVA